MNILVCRGVSQNDVLTEMSGSLAQALAECGAGVEWASFAGPQMAEDVAQRIAATGADWVVSFGSGGADLLTRHGQSIYDAAGCGFVGWDVDHPVYQFKRFSTAIRRRIQISASPSHARFARLMGCQATDMAMLPGVNAVSTDRLAIEDRPILTTVAMTWLGEPEIWWNDAKGTPAYSLVDGVVGRLLADERADLFEAYQATLADTGLEVRFDEHISNIMARIGLFVRQYDRLQFAQTLASLGLPSLICGTGWKDRLGEQSHITYLDNLNVTDLNEIYGQSRAVFNLNAANGASERAMMAMAAGAVVISDYGPLLESEFEANGGMQFFDRSRPASLAEAVDSALASGGAQTIADRGHELISRAGLWSHKATRLLERLDQVHDRP